MEMSREVCSYSVERWLRLGTPQKSEKGERTVNCEEHKEILNGGGIYEICPEYWWVENQRPYNLLGLNYIYIYIYIIPAFFFLSFFFFFQNKHD